MAELQTLARPYARAAFSVAREAQDLAGWGDALQRLAEAARMDTLATAIGHPLVSRTALVEVLTQAASLTETQVNLVRVMADNGRLKLLPAVAEEFAALRAAFENARSVTITSASTVDQGQQQRLLEALQQRLGAEVTVDWQTREDLLGGAVISAGDMVIDGSVQGELTRLRAGLTQ